MVKLDALGYPNSPAFNASDAQQYRTLVVFLENEKVRCLPPADRGCLVWSGLGHGRVLPWTRPCVGFAQCGRTDLHNRYAGGNGIVQDFFAQNR